MLLEFQHTVYILPTCPNELHVLFNKGGCDRLQDHCANVVAAARAQEPRAARREARVFAPRVVARVPAVEPQRTPEAAHAVRLASVVEAGFRDRVETRAREAHMCLVKLTIYHFANEVASRAAQKSQAARQ